MGVRFDGLFVKPEAGYTTMLPRAMPSASSGVSNEPNAGSTAAKANPDTGYVTTSCDSHRQLATSQPPSPYMELDNNSRRDGVHTPVGAVKTLGCKSCRIVKAGP